MKINRTEKINTRRWWVLVAAVALVAAACGDDGGSSEDTGGAGSTEAPVATDAAAPEPTAAPAPSEAPEPTEPPTPSTEPPVAENPLLETARGVVGSWTGSWTNTTFGSTGPISGDITLDEEAMTLTVNSDVGGFVFGASDPDPEVLTLPLTPGEHTGSSPTFGDWTLTIGEDGTFSVTAINLPAIPAGTFTLQGALTDTGIDGTYQVDFGDGSAPAEGTITITKG